MKKLVLQIPWFLFLSLFSNKPLIHLSPQLFSSGFSWGLWELWMSLPFHIFTHIGYNLLCLSKSNFALQFTLHSDILKVSSCFSVCITTWQCRQQYNLICLQLQHLISTAFTVAVLEWKVQCIHKQRGQNYTNILHSALFSYIFNYPCSLIFVACIYCVPLSF
jgi:hypothetical protein